MFADEPTKLNGSPEARRAFDRRVLRPTSARGGRRTVSHLPQYAIETLAAETSSRRHGVGLEADVPAGKSGFSRGHKSKNKRNFEEYSG